MDKKLRLIPLFVMLLLAGALAAGLFTKDKEDNIDKLNEGKNFSDFSIPSLTKDNKITAGDFIGQVAVVNVFASWCVPCAVEHDSLLKLAQRVNIYGIAWKDKPETVLAYLQRKGNPFYKVGVDVEGKTTVPMYLTGVPETFILDKQGKIVFHYKSVLSEDIINNTMLPIIERLIDSTDKQNEKNN